MAFNILQINFRGLTHNKALFEEYIYRNKIDVAILSEIKLKKTNKLSLNIMKLKQKLIAHTPFWRRSDIIQQKIYYKNFSRQRN